MHKTYFKETKKKKGKILYGKKVYPLNKSMKPIKPGKITKLNQKANKILGALFEESNIKRCEIKFAGCTGYLFNAPAHRHKRGWYRTKPELLSSYNQAVCACTPCHQIIEGDRKLTEEVFMRLRGAEVVNPAVE